MSAKAGKRRQRRTTIIECEPEEKPLHEILVEQSDDAKLTVSADTDKSENAPKEEIITISTEKEPPLILSIQEESEEIHEIFEIKQTNGQPEEKIEIDVKSETLEVVMNSAIIDEVQLVDQQLSDNTEFKTLSVAEELEQPEQSVVCRNEVRINITRLPDLVTNGTEERSENTSYGSAENILIDTSSYSDQILESDITNASVLVNCNDTIRNDVTVDDATPSFAETTKNMTYGEVLRSLSGRRALRNQKLYYDALDGIRKYTPLPNQKRKFLSESPEDVKRIRIEEETSGLLSFIPSPFKAKAQRSEIASSTPKLTSFKYAAGRVSSTDCLEEMSNLDLESDEKPKSGDPKKWCAIM